MYITFDLILYNQFTLFRLSEKGKKLELIDHVKGIQYNFSFCTREVREKFKEWFHKLNFCSSFTQLIFIMLLIDPWGSKKLWIKIAFFSLEVPLVDFRPSCESVGAQLW